MILYKCYGVYLLKKDVQIEIDPSSIIQACRPKWCSFTASMLGTSEDDYSTEYFSTLVSEKAKENTLAKNKPDDRGLIRIDGIIWQIEFTRPEKDNRVVRIFVADEEDEIHKLLKPHEIEPENWTLDKAKYAYLKKI